jgi:hypothetical protein
LHGDSCWLLSYIWVATDFFLIPNEVTTKVFFTCEWVSTHKKGPSSIRKGYN